MSYINPGSSNYGFNPYNYNTNVNGNNFSNPLYQQQVERLNNIQAPVYPQQMQQQPNNQVQEVPTGPQPNIIRPVTSIEEVKSVTPLFDGSKLYFHDISQEKFYVKYLGLNGLPVTDIFEKLMIPLVPETTNNNNNNINLDNFVVRNEFEELKAKINQYEILFNNLMGFNNNSNNSNLEGAKKNDESVATN